MSVLHSQISENVSHCSTSPAPLQSCLIKRTRRAEVQLVLRTPRGLGLHPGERRATGHQPYEGTLQAAKNALLPYREPSPAQTSISLISTHSAGFCLAVAPSGIFPSPFLCCPGITVLLCCDGLSRVCAPTPTTSERQQLCLSFHYGILSTKHEAWPIRGAQDICQMTKEHTSLPLEHL